MKQKKRIPQAVWTQAEVWAWRRPKKLRVSEWADEFRILNAITSAEPGKWNTSRVPYLKEVMDAFTDPFVEEITVMSASQVGKTESILNMLGYVIDQDPGPTLVVMPREDDAKGISSDRVLPMIKDSRALSQHLPILSDDVSKLEYRLDRMYLYFAGSNSPANLASRPIRYLFLDEIDKYPKFSGQEADPVRLAMERQKTFWNKKTVKVSTPTTREGYIYREFERSDKRRFYVPCPHCEKYQILVLGQIKWPDEETTPERIKNERLAWYECYYCKKKVEDYHKNKILSLGKWVSEADDIDAKGNIKAASFKSKHRGFWINSLYSPWLSWSDIACEFLRSKDYIELLMNFVNSWLAEVWEERIEETTVDKIKTLCRDYDKGFVPEDCLVLTAGVDVQKGHFYYVIRGWGYNETSWLIRAERVEKWEDVVFDIFKTQYKRINNEITLNVFMTCVDSGYRTDEVYEFCRRSRDRAKAVKGQENISGGRFFNPTRIDVNSRTGSVIQGGLILWHVNVSQYKDKINRLVTSRDPVKWNLYRNPSELYLEQFTSEHKILVRNRTKGTAKEVWQKKKETLANHFLDAEVYTMAAADIIRALNLRKEGTAVYRSEDEEYSRKKWPIKPYGKWKI